MVYSFTEIVLLAAKKYNRNLSVGEGAKTFYKQQTVEGIKTKVITSLGDDEKKRWLARKALNNWLSRLKNQFRPREFKKNVKVESAATHSDEGSGNGEQDESASDEEEDVDREEKMVIQKKCH
jgi:DNA-directed RNA polymerase specialized sigma24 family protein